MKPVKYLILFTLILSLTSCGIVSRISRTTRNILTEAQHPSIPDEAKVIVAYDDTGL